jgi:hypothetical protein
LCIMKEHEAIDHVGKALCSSPVTEDVPPRRDRSIHGVPPSVAGLVHSRSVPLHPTSVTGLVHSRSVYSVKLCTYICPRMYAHSAGHIQLNLINAIAFSPAQLHAFRFSPAQLCNFSPTQLCTFSPTQLRIFSPAQLCTFSPAQVRIVYLAKYICDNAHDLYTPCLFVVGI